MFVYDPKRTLSCWLAVSVLSRGHVVSVVPLDPEPDPAWAQGHQDQPQELYRNRPQPQRPQVRRTFLANSCWIFKIQWNVIKSLNSLKMLKKNKWNQHQQWISMKGCKLIKSCKKINNRNTKSKCCEYLKYFELLLNI